MNSLLSPLAQEIAFSACLRQVLFEFEPGDPYDIPLDQLKKLSKKVEQLETFSRVHSVFAERAKKAQLSGNHLKEEQTETDNRINSYYIQSKESLGNPTTAR